LVLFVPPPTLARGFQNCTTHTGGSYPGWLSAMMRIRYPEVVDMSYAGTLCGEACCVERGPLVCDCPARAAASAPLGFYSQVVDQYAYYKLVTESAVRASSGCADAVRAMLTATLAAASSKAQIIAGANLCTPLPSYLDAGDTELLVEEVSMIVMYTFATLNMENYPPGPATGLAMSCAAIEDAVAAGNEWGALYGFLVNYSESAMARRRLHAAPAAAAHGAAGACYNMASQMPSGDAATISSGDWSGVGVGNDGSSWDFETCTYMIESIGVNNVTDMFIPRASSLEWLNAHCAARFSVVPAPRALANLWGFDADRLPSVTSRIIFTNGLNDGWSAGGIMTNLSSTILAYTMPNGAHHSDLSHSWPSAADTPDVVAVRAAVADLIAGWLSAL
jgi:hypothetical protein